MFSKMKVPTSNLQRLLMEFPWLWAVRQEWSEYDKIDVGNANFRLLKFGFLGRTFSGTKVWVVATCDDSTTIFQAKVRSGWNVDIIFEDLPTTQHRVTHVVLDTPRWHEVQIFRTPAGFNRESARDYVGN